jgi:hypothetical protein
MSCVDSRVPREKGQRTCGLGGAPVAGVRARAADSRDSAREVGLIDRAPSGDTSLIAVMDDEHHVGRLRSQR